MPLSTPAARRDIHHRVIDMKAYAREDGLYDVEARLVDTKPFPFQRPSSPDPIPAGQPLHDIWLRLTVDGEFVVRAIEAASDVTPWSICKQAEGTLQVLVGEKLARGWSAKVKERLRGAASCTHLMEMLIPMATTGLQGIRALQLDRYLHAEGEDGPLKIDSCYAYGRSREVVQKLWPLHYRPPATQQP
jgi:hypothetical protein